MKNAIKKQCKNLLSGIVSIVRIAICTREDKKFKYVLTIENAGSRRPLGEVIVIIDAGLMIGAGLRLPRRYAPRNDTKGCT